MPVDSEGNITTTKTVTVKTITEVMRESKVDTLALHDGGMARVAKDKVDGAGVVLTANTSTP